MTIHCQSGTCVRWSRTLVVLLTMINLGVNLGIFSPTFPAIEHLTSSTTSQVSTTLVWMGVASVLGCVLLGSLFDHCKDGMILLAVGLLLQGLALGLAPYFRSLWAYQAFAAIASFFNYGTMTGCLSMNGRYWADFPSLLGPVIQATVLVHTIGTALTPQIVEPFLGEHESCRKSQNITLSTAHHTSSWSAYSFSNSTTAFIPNLSTNGTAASSTGPLPPSEGSLLPVQVAYLIVAIFDVVVSVVCLVTYLVALNCTSTSCTKVNLGGATISCNSDDEQDLPLISESSSTRNDTFSSRADSPTRRRSAARPAPESSTSSSSLVHASHPSGSNENVVSLSWRCRTVGLVSIICLYFMVNGGRDSMLTGMLYTYTCENLGWTISWSTRLVTVYHLGRVGTHLIIVFVSRCVTSRALSIFNLAVLVVSSTVMLGTLYTQDGVLFTGASVVVMGIATSNIHPTAITLTSESLHVSGKVMGILLAALASGQIIVAPLTGLLLQSSGGVVGFPALLLALSLAGVVIFALWMIYVGQFCVHRNITRDIAHISREELRE